MGGNKRLKQNLADCLAVLEKGILVLPRIKVQPRQVAEISGKVHTAMEVKTEEHLGLLQKFNHCTDQIK